MTQVAEYVADLQANPPPGGVRDERWRGSLMSVGHDPLKP